MKNTHPSDRDPTSPDALWEAHRDGTLSAADQAAFEAYLRADPERAALWEAESKWLDLLAEDNAASRGGFDAAFTGRVLNAWSGTGEESPVVGRLGGRPHWAISLSAGVGFAAAAVVALMVWFNGWAGLNTSPRDAPPVAIDEPDAPDGGTRLAAADVDRIFQGPVDPDAAPSPVSALVRDVDWRVSQQSAKLRAALDQTQSYLSLSQVIELLDVRDVGVPLPDPADYVDAPKRRG